MTSLGLFQAQVRTIFKIKADFPVYRTLQLYNQSDPRKGVIKHRHCCSVLFMQAQLHNIQLEPAIIVSLLCLLRAHIFQRQRSCFMYRAFCCEAIKAGFSSDETQGKNIKQWSFCLAFYLFKLFCSLQPCLHSYRLHEVVSSYIRGNTIPTVPTFS